MPDEFLHELHEIRVGMGNEPLNAGALGEGHLTLRRSPEVERDVLFYIGILYIKLVIVLLFYLTIYQLNNT